MFSYLGWGPGPGRVWATCCGGRKSSQSQTAGLSSQAHSGPQGSPGGGCPPLLSGILEEGGWGKKKKERQWRKWSEPDTLYSLYSINEEMIGLLGLVTSPGKVCDQATALPWEKGGDREQEDGSKAEGERDRESWWRETGRGVRRRGYCRCQWLEGLVERPRSNKTRRWTQALLCFCLTSG